MSTFSRPAIVVADEAHGRAFASHWVHPSPTYRPLDCISKSFTRSFPAAPIVASCRSTWNSGAAAAVTRGATAVECVRVRSRHAASLCIFLESEGNSFAAPIKRATREPNTSALPRFSLINHAGAITITHSPTAAES